MDRFPIIITLGAAILGYVAGEMLVTEPALADNPLLREDGWLYRALPLASAALVIVLGKWIFGRKPETGQPELIELAREDEQPRRDRRSS
jgi:hypothetical protein